MNKTLIECAINPSFYHRYFRQNAESRFALSQLEFMLWRRGRFIRPHEKAAVLDQFTNEEIHNFYEKKEINLPQLQFAITTRCTLQCRDCNAMIPSFHQATTSHIDLSFAEFKRCFDTLMSTATRIRRFMLLGGEPLINKDLPDIVDYCARHPGLTAVEIITNGTLMPSKQLLSAASEHGQKVYFHLSNYSKNPALLPRLKYAAIIETLKKRGLKHQMSMNLDWNREEPLRLHAYSQKELQTMFDNCWLKRCLQVLGGKLSLCPRLSSGYALGILAPPQGECIDLHAACGSFRQTLLDFFDKSYFASCRYCVRLDERIEPALQG